jgi:uncharacterized Fe-S cluster protein YjdI
MTKKLQVYDSDELVVTFDPNVCVHSGICLQTLPAVFDVSRKRWIAIEAATPDEVAAAVAKCPSGALQAIRAGRAAAPASSGAGVEITVRPNGPLFVLGPVRVLRESGETVEKEKCSLCRCGRTGNAPFCDGTHKQGLTASS